MIKKIILGFTLISTIFPAIYGVGDVVSSSHQNVNYPVCYGNYETEGFKLSDLNGETNGGVYKVSLIDMSATWCDPCVAFIPEFDGIVDDWSDNDGVFIFNALMDMNQPYSCEQWGDMGIINIPVIVNDGNGGGNSIFSFFNTGSAIPSTVFIDHEMRVQYMSNQVTSNQANNIIENMLDDCTMCGNPDYDSDFVLNETDNCPNDYNPEQEDEDYDNIGDVCDSCHNMSGDPNDDLFINITDVILTVNLISTGGITSEFYNECEKADANFNGDETINVLDIIHMINIILGNTVLNSNIDNMATVNFNQDNNQLLINISSDIEISGIQLNSNSLFSNVKLLQNNEKELISNEDVILAYSLQNIPFENNKIELILDNTHNLNIEDIQIVVSDMFGNELSLIKSENGNIYSNGVHEFKLNNSYPNPFNPATKLDFSLPMDANIQLVAYNIHGQKVQEIYSGFQTIGSHQFTWDASHLSSGIYIVKLISENHQASIQTILMK